MTMDTDDYVCPGDLLGNVSEYRGPKNHIYTTIASIANVSIIK